MKQGEFIQEVLITIDMTQTELGERTGRTRQAIRKFTCDEAEDIKVSTLMELLDVMGYDIVLVPKGESKLRPVSVSRGENHVEYAYITM